MTARLSASLLLFSLASSATASTIHADFTQLGYLYYPRAVSNGGKVVVGNTYHPYGFVQASIPTPLKNYYFDSLYDVTADGQIGAGRGIGSEPLGPGNVPDHYVGTTYATSANGGVMAGLGYVYTPSTPSGGYPGTPFRWSADRGFENLPTLAGTTQSKVVGMSSDGSVIVGYNDSTPVKWTVRNGAPVVSVLDIKGDPRQIISGDWSFIYRENGYEALKDFLMKSTDIDKLLLSKYHFENVAISDDGTALTGWATKNGFERGFLVTFDSMPTGLPGASSGPVNGGVQTPEPTTLSIGVLAGVLFCSRRVRSRR